MVSLKGRHGDVWTVAITPDRRQVVSASQDGGIKVWDLTTRSLKASFTGDNQLTACCASNQFRSKVFVAGEQSGQVHILQLEGLE
jgi:WD40 repeat protein